MKHNAENPPHNDHDTQHDPLSRRHLLGAMGAALVVGSGAAIAASRGKGLHVQETSVALSDLDLTLVDQQWSVPRRNLAVSGKPLSIGGRKFTNGVGTHANSLIVVRLERGTRRFRALAGVDDNTEARGSVRFSVQGDGRELWNSGIRHRGDAALPIDLDVSRVRYLTLHVDDTGDNNSNDHGNWAEATFEGVRRSPALVTRLPHEEKAFLPGRLWLDTNGKPIQAHGGGILRHNNRWWWYGEDRSAGYVAIGASAYVSDDLLRWKHAGVVLPRSSYNQVHGDQTLCERPKVLFNPTTRQFVMWFHYDRAGYGDSRAGVAVADRPEGPFHFLGAHRPIEKSTFRDMGVFVDDDKRAYVFYAGEENATMHVVRLNASWTGPEMPMVQGQTWDRILIGKMREAPAPFKHAGKYYLITSGCTGWAANPADLAVAARPLGPYTSLGNPCIGPGADKTFNTQSTFVLPIPGAPAGNFLYLGDRWKPEALADARYVWLPFRIEGNRAPLQWASRWTLSSRGARMG
ncbi:MAG: hypothetical protein JWN98_1208 [Abditibacteriota bacterium]|nr:hypothetical protein [Abditibacteriota bacterium]